MSFTLTGWMLYAMWGVIAMMGIRLVVGIYQSLTARNFPTTPILNFLQSFVFYVFPLYLIANMMPLDPTGVLFSIAYYVGAVGAIAKSITDIGENI